MDLNLTRDDYLPQGTEKAKQACLHIATVLGAALDELTVVGGLVPTLLVPAQNLPDGFSPHIGTLDLDLGLSLALLDEALYATVAAQLRQSGFRPDVNEKGNPTLQRWRPPDDLAQVTVDFLIPVSAGNTRPDRIMKLEQDFGAVVTAGLQLVGRDRRKVAVSGTTLTGARARREIWVCGPAAYVILKARAIHGREKSKDAYDLCYILQCHADRLDKVAVIVTKLLDDRDAQEALEWLADDFADATALGPERYARFLGQPQSAALREDAVGLVQELLRLVRT